MTVPADADNRLFSTFAYTGNGEGGVEDKLLQGALAYLDDALLYLDFVPDSLRGARLFRTANRDRKYWANDYIVATAARDIDLFVAHDVAAPKPAWLRDYRATSDFLQVNGRRLALYHRRLKQDERLQISGSVDQGQNASPALNLILLAKPVL